MEEMEQPRKRMSCGLDLTSVPFLNEQLHNAIHDGYHFIVIPIVHPRYRREMICGKAKDRDEPLSRSDLILTSNDWTRLIVGKLSPYLEVDSEIDHVRKQSEEVFSQELDFASHLSLPALMLPIYSSHNANMAQILLNKFGNNCSYQVWVQVKMKSKEDTWDWWNTMRQLCDYDKKLCLALELTEELPSEAELARWLGEPVKCIIISTKLFITNLRNYPVLSKAHQEIVKRFLPIDVQYIITGKNRHASIENYCNYISYLGKKLHTSSTFTEYIQGVEDYLQNPLQPLADNLETMIYEVFEKDPHKYNQYQLAIRQAIEDKAKLIKDRDLIVMVVGAGRGPLVRAVLNAAQITGNRMKIYAVEKNIYAVNTLRALVRELWAGKVTVISGDMRVLSPEEKADILVSELLGSFGDNELSPECLDGAQRFLKDDGISIPASYTSWLAPVQSIKLFTEIGNKRCPDYKGHKRPFETPFVVHLVNYYRIDNTQALFTFIHPNKEEVFDNRRYKIVRFKCTQNCVLTGFAGYFSCDLYKGISISTEPNTHTTDMTSWFPIYFPLNDAVQLQANDSVDVAFWRCVSKNKVWYEWCVVKPKVGNIHNTKGRTYTINH